MAVHMRELVMGALPELRVHPVDKWVRATVGDTLVVSSRSPRLVWEPRRVVPSYAVPRDDVAGELAPFVEPDGSPAAEHPVALDRGGPPVLDPRTPFSAHSCPGTPLTIRAGNVQLAGAAFAPDDPDLAGYVVLDFNAFDWLEDDEEIIGHPRDPFHRVDIRASSLTVEVGLDGVTLATTNGAQLLYETMLPVRYYIPPSDVRLDLMEESPKRTICPYKGQASYWSYPASGQGRNVAWSYDRRLLDAAQIHGLVSFFNERVDITVDGVRQERPVTPWSRPDGAGAPGAPGV